MLKVLREGLKSDQIKQDEIAGRVGEIYDYIADSKDALVEANVEIKELRAKIRALEDDTEFKKSLSFDERGYYKRNGPEAQELYCSSCLDEKHQRIRLTGAETPVCHIHGYRE